MSITELMHVSKPAEPVRRIEVFTGSGRRRRWSAAEKAAIVVESFGADETVSAVARRHGLTPQQLFAWRREARQEPAPSATPMFVPAVVEAPAEEPEPKRRRRSAGAEGVIELEVGGVTVRIGRGADAKAITAVIRALKAGA